MIKKFIVNNLTFLGQYKRFGVALKDCYSAKKASYSQHKEDAYIWEILSKYDLTDSIYTDVGANHPTDISNTYLLYRNGLNGVVIEPNPELVNLFLRFRPKDITLAIGCGNQTAISKFNISKTPVMSSFSERTENNTYKSVYVPVMKLDQALENIEYEYIHLLSIDVEGINLEVLKGAEKTLAKSLLLCIEFDNQQDKIDYSQLLGNKFTLLKEFGCNMLYINNSLNVSKLKSTLTPY